MNQGLKINWVIFRLDEILPRYFKKRVREIKNNAFYQTTLRCSSWSVDFTKHVLKKIRRLCCYAYTACQIGAVWARSLNFLPLPFRTPTKQAMHVGVRKLPSAPLHLPLLSRSPTICFCMWEAVRIFYVAYMKNFLEEARRWRRRRCDCSVIRAFAHERSFWLAWCE